VNCTLPPLEHLFNEPLPEEWTRDFSPQKLLADRDGVAVRPQAPLFDGPGGDPARTRGSVGRAGVALGLSISHIGRKPLLTLWAGASLIEVETGKRRPSPFPDRQGRRAKVTYYSPRSAKRHKNTLAKVCRTARPLLVVLTYPKEFPLAVERKTYKGHLKAFRERLRYHYPKIAGTWKLEFQERTAPHFHLELWNVPADSWNSERAKAYDFATHEEFKAWLSNAWFEVVASGDQKHLRAGTSCERARTVAGMISYASSYSAKPEQTLRGVECGRYWGVFNRSNIPWGEKWEVPTTEREAVIVQRTARRLEQSRAKAAALKRLKESKAGKWKLKRGCWVKKAKPLKRREVKRTRCPLAFSPDDTQKLLYYGGPPKRVLNAPASARKEFKRKVHRMPKLRTGGASSAIVDADWWIERLPAIRGQYLPLRLCKRFNFRPCLP